MISLSHDLEYRVVAEGIETEGAAEILTQMGCDEGQGYFFARPMERASFEQWLDLQEHAQVAAERSKIAVC